MQLAALTFFHVRIPLRREVRHASHVRTETDSLVVRSDWTSGLTGWGEGLPRHYVTGETIDDAWGLLASTNFAARLGQEPLGQDRANRTPEDWLSAVRALALGPVPAGARQCFGNSARCAVELSLLDGLCRHAGIPVSRVVDLVPECAPIRGHYAEACYSAAITTMSPRKAAIQAFLFRAAQFRACKIKVTGQPDDPELVERLRKRLGPKIELRIDANESWSVEGLREQMERFVPHGVLAVEQPVPVEETPRLAGTRGTWPIPVMLDESLCSMDDAEAAIRDGTCDLFNIRLSKCGGFVPSLLIAARAHEAGIGYQLGCQVGETGILSAAGRHFASAVSGLRWTEGSFDRYLVREWLTRQDLTFGWGGKGAPLVGPGLGVDVNPEALARVTIRTMSCPIS